MSTSAIQQDVIFDHTNGQKTAVTTSAIILTPAATTVFVWIATDAPIVLNTNNAAAVDDGSGVYLGPGWGIFPVTGVAIYALSLSGTANVRAVAMKSRPVTYG